MRYPRIETALILFGLLVLTSCGGGGGGENTLTDQQIALLKGHWSGVLTVSNDSCGDEDLSQDLSLTNEIVVYGNNVQVSFSPEGDLSFSSSSTETLNKLLGETAIGGGFSASDQNTSCYRCASSTISYENITTHAAPETCTAVDSETGEVISVSTGCGNGYVTADVEFSHSPLNGSGGCTVIWAGQMSKQL